MADPLDQYRGYAFETDNPVVNFLRRMNKGELAPQQSTAAWLREHPITREFAQRAVTQLPMALGARVGAPRVNSPQHQPPDSFAAVWAERSRIRSELQRLAESGNERAGQMLRDMDTRAAALGERLTTLRGNIQNELGPLPPQQLPILNPTPRDLYAFDSRGRGRNVHIDDVPDRVRALNYWQGLRDFDALQPPPQMPQSRPGSPTQGQRDLYALEPNDMPLTTRPLRDIDRAEAYWNARRSYGAAAGPQSVPPSNAPQRGPTQPQRDFHALPPAGGVTGRTPRSYLDALYEFETMRPPPRNRMHADGGEVHPRDQALLDLEWDRSPENWVLRQGKGFVGGATNPFGSAAALTRRLPGGEVDSRYRSAMDRWEDEAPHASTAGSLAALGTAMGKSMSRRNASHLLGVLASIAPVVRNVQDVVTGEGRRREERQRAREYGAAGYNDGGVILAQYMPPSMMRDGGPWARPPETPYRFKMPHEQRELPRDVPPPPPPTPSPSGSRMPQEQDDPLAQYSRQPR